MPNYAKSGQLSIFLILSIVVLFGAMAFFSINSDSTSKDTALISALDSGSIDQVKTFVDSCVKRSAEDAISLVGIQGGYSTPPIDAIEVETSSDQINIPIYLKDTTISSPTLDMVKDAISSSVAQKIKTCTANFQTISGLIIREGEIQVTTQVNPSFVIVNLNFPITIQKGSASATLSSFSTQIPSHLMELFDSGIEIAQFSSTTNKEICVSCLLDLENNRDINISIEDYGGQVLLYSLSPLDKKSLPLVFNFAHQYST